MDTKRVVAKRIKLARVERELKQKDLADLLGVNQQNVTRFESGNVSIGVDTLARIAAALNKPVGYFFEEFDEVPTKKAQSPGARAKKRKAA
jgi:transcriptional regulator with XRE-family HTH domain